MQSLILILVLVVFVGCGASHYQQPAHPHHYDDQRGANWPDQIRAAKTNEVTNPK